MSKPILTAGTVLEVTGSGVTEFITAVSPDAFNLGTVTKGRGRVIGVDQSDGTMLNRHDYHDFWNYMTTALVVGDRVVVVPAMDKDDVPINVAVIKVT